MYQTVTFQIHQVLILTGSTHVHTHTHTHTHAHTFFKTCSAIFQMIVLSLSCTSVPYTHHTYGVFIQNIKQHSYALQQFGTLNRLPVNYSGFQVGKYHFSSFFWLLSAVVIQIFGHIQKQNFVASGNLRHLQSLTILMISSQTARIYSDPVLDPNVCFAFKPKYQQ